MTPAYIRANERCLKRLIRARNILQANIKALKVSDVFKVFHYCLSQDVYPIVKDIAGDIRRPSSILELMPFIYSKVSEAELELRLLEDNLTKRIKEISDDIERYKSRQSNQYDKTNF